MSSAHAPLLHTIARHARLSDADAAACIAAFDLLDAPRGTVLEPAGRTPQNLYFIAAGFVRLFYVDDAGEEVTTGLAGPGDFTAAFLPLVHQTVSEEAVVCLTDCTLLRCTRTALLGLIGRSEAFRSFSLLIFESGMAGAQARANDLATLPAEARYRKLLAERPAVVGAVPVQYIASYLGMKPESLSRIRRQIIS